LLLVHVLLDTIPELVGRRVSEDRNHLRFTFVGNQRLVEHKLVLLELQWEELKWA
jgi:hypothetical protein